MIIHQEGRRIRPDELKMYLTLSGDSNPIHDPSNPHAVIPGVMLAMISSAAISNHAPKGSVITGGKSRYHQALHVDEEFNLEVSKGHESSFSDNLVVRYTTKISQDQKLLAEFEVIIVQTTADI